MSMQKPLEGLLRPPIEWLTTVSALAIAAAYYRYPDIFLLSRQSMHPVTGTFIVFALYRFKQGFRVFRYQRRLKRMPSFKLSANKIPVNTKKLYLGSGFLWTSQHTQRLRDLDLDYNLSYKYPSSLRHFFRQKEIKWNGHPILKYAAKLTQIDHWLNPLRPYPDVGGEPCVHGVADKEDDIFIDLIERASHLLVMGVPGVGKTRFAELIISQDIKRGDVVIVIDPKGDAELLQSMYIAAKLAGREDDLLVFHLGFPEHSCRYNPIGNFTRITEVANRITKQLPSSGDSAAFKEFGWKFTNSIAKALVAMGEKPDYQKLKFYITKMDVLLERYLDFWLPQLDNNYEHWINAYIKNKTTEKREVSRIKALIAYVEQHKLIQNPIYDDLHSAYRYDREYFSKITASLSPLLDKLTTGQSAELLSPDYNDLKDERPILDWLQVIRCNKIVYVGLDAMTDAEIASAVGNAMLSDLTSVAGRLYKFGLHDGFYKSANDRETIRPIRLHSDEFNESIDEEFIRLINKGRGSGFTITAYTQTWSDVEARLHSRAKAGQIAGNLGSVVLFRCKEAATVETFLSQLPKVPILRAVPASVAQDTPFGSDGIYYQSSNEDRFAHSEQRLIEQNDVLNLPKGQAFCLLEGGKLYKIRMPILVKNNISLPRNIETLMTGMHEQKRFFYQKESNHENVK